MLIIIIIIAIIIIRKIKKHNDKMYADVDIYVPAHAYKDRKNRRLNRKIVKRLYRSHKR